ncbi:ATP-binding cassette domain-containing protein [Saccharopolyspora pogona]|uniref:ATP-binding cassette domain-containing protein n=1 Tax=Saccharopolyspora pogona TaxID=333966 RepID=UPI00295A8822|nr:ATP-binding cassette domain-containing protein [Saccharopolyspora pogona]
MTASIRVEGLVKRFGTTNVVNGLDLTVPTGKVLALLGSNGAGKTTTVRMLSTLLRPDAGHATINGYDLVKQAKQVRRSIGLTGQYASVDAEISGRDNLYLIGRLLNLSRGQAKARASDLLEQFALTDVASKQARHYSGGMRRRLDLAASLVGEPELIYLDEPTTGLDPQRRNDLWDVVRDRVTQGATVLLTTQYMEEAEALADLVVVMDKGRTIASGTPSELKTKVGGEVLRIRPERPADLVAVTRALQSARLRSPKVDAEQGMVTMPIHGEGELTMAVHVLAACGVPLKGIDTYVPDLDEVFLTLTNKPVENGDDGDVTMVMPRVEPALAPPPPPPGPRIPPPGRLPVGGWPQFPPQHGQFPPQHRPPHPPPRWR